MKPIEGVDVKRCYELAEQQVNQELHNIVTARIKNQLMAVAQLKIKADTSVMESTKLTTQLTNKEALLEKIKNGSWESIPVSADEQDKTAQKLLNNQVTTND